MAKSKATVVGYGKCVCKHSIKVLLSANGNLCFLCDPPHSDGCGLRVYGGAQRSNEFIAQRVERWSHPEIRDRVLGEDEPDELEREEVEIEEPDAVPVPPPTRSPRSRPTPRPKPRPASRQPDPWE